MESIYDRIKSHEKGLLYVHCWHGLHASGYIASITLMQFCDLSPELAISYWEKAAGCSINRFPQIREKIYNFIQYSDLELTESEKNLVCPETIFN